MMKKQLYILIFCALYGANGAYAQVVKPDYVRTPNGPNTIVDWNVKFKTMILPHDSVLSLSGSQDTTGHVQVFYDGTRYGLYYYIKPDSGIGFWVQAGGNGVDTSSLKQKADTVANSGYVTNGKLNSKLLNTNSDINNGLLLTVSGSTAHVSPGSYAINGTNYIISKTLNQTLPAPTPGKSQYVLFYGTTSSVIDTALSVPSSKPVFPDQPINTALIGYVYIQPSGSNVYGLVPVTTTGNQVYYGIKNAKSLAEFSAGVKLNFTPTPTKNGSFLALGVDSLLHLQTGGGGTVIDTSSLKQKSDSTADTGYVTHYYLKSRLGDSVSYSGLTMLIHGTGVIVKPGSYTLDDSTFTTGGTRLNIDRPDKQMSRYDVIYGDTTGKLDTLSGILSLNPIVPSLPPYTIEIAQVLITPGGTSLSYPDNYFIKEGNVSQHVQGTKTFDDAEAAVDANKPMQFATLEQVFAKPDSNTMGNPITLDYFNGHLPAAVDTNHFIQNQGAYEQVASAWINGMLKIDHQAGSVALSIGNNIGTAISSYGYNFFGNGAGYGTLTEFGQSVRIDDPYKLTLVDAPVSGTDAVNLEYLQVNYKLASDTNYAHGYTPRWYAKYLSDQILNNPDFSNGATVTGQPLIVGQINTIGSGGINAMTINGNNIVGNSNGIYSDITVSFGIYLKPGYEGVYTNDYTTGKEIFHFGVPNEADEASRIDENFELNFALPKYLNPIENAQVIVKDNTVGYDGFLAQIPATNFVMTTPGRIGTAQLAGGTISLPIISVMPSSTVFISFVSIGGIVTNTWQYAGVCTAGTLTITALNNSGCTNAADTSTLNYEIIN